MAQQRRSLLTVHRRDQEEQTSTNNLEDGAATGEVQDRDNLSNESPKVDEGANTAEEWNRDVDIIDETAGTAAAAADKEIPKTNNSGDDGANSGISIRVTIPPLLLTLSPTPDRLTFPQVRTIHDAAERTIEAYFTSLNSDDNDRNVLEDGIEFSYSKLLGVTLDEWVGSDGRSICGVDAQDARDTACSNKQPKACVYGSTAEEDVCANGELCFANIAPSCGGDGDRRGLIRGPAQSRHLAYTDAYTVIQLAGGIANFRVVTPAAAPNEKRLGRLSEKAIEKGLVKALAELNDPIFDGIVDVDATPLTPSDAPFLGVAEEMNEMEPEVEGSTEVIDAKEDEAVDANGPKEAADDVGKKEANEVADDEGIEDINEDIEDIEEEEEETQNEDDTEDAPVAIESNEPTESIGEPPMTVLETVQQPQEPVAPASGEEIPPTMTDPSNETPMRDISPVVRDPPKESSGTVLPGAPLGPVGGDEGASAINFKANAEMAPPNNSPLIGGVVTVMILLAIGLVFSVIAFRRNKHRNKGNIEGDADNLIDFEGRNESDLEASESLGKSSPVLATIKESEGEANEEGSGATDESSSNSAPNLDEPENLVSPTELSSIVHVRSRSPPKAQQQQQEQQQQQQELQQKKLQEQERQLQKQQLHELLDQDMISISETTVSHTDTSLGLGTSLRPSESFEIRRHFESITVRKDMLIPDITTGMESHDHRSTNVINTELARVPKNVDVEDRGNLITYPRHLQQNKGRQHRPSTGLNIQSEV